MDLAPAHAAAVMMRLAIATCGRACPGMSDGGRSVRTMNEDLCRDCGDTNTNGDSWDGLCGRCADHASCEDCGGDLDVSRDGDHPLCADCRPLIAMAA